MLRWTTRRIRKNWDTDRIAKPISLYHAKNLLHERKNNLPFLSFTSPLIHEFVKFIKIYIITYISYRKIYVPLFLAYMISLDENKSNFLQLVSKNNKYSNAIRLEIIFATVRRTDRNALSETRYADELFSGGFPASAGISMSRNYDRQRDQCEAHSRPSKWVTKWLLPVGAFPQERVLILQSGCDIYYQFTTSRAVKHDPRHIYMYMSLYIRIHGTRIRLVKVISLTHLSEVRLLRFPSTIQVFHVNRFHNKAGDRRNVRISQTTTTNDMPRKWGG